MIFFNLFLISFFCVPLYSDLSSEKVGNSIFFLWLSLTFLFSEFSTLTKKSQEDLESEFYDRFCHKQDRAFSPPELLHWLKNAGLYFTGLNESYEKFRPVLSKNLDSDSDSDSRI